MAERHLLTIRHERVTDCHSTECSLADLSVSLDKLRVFQYLLISCPAAFDTCPWTFDVAHPCCAAPVLAQLNQEGFVSFATMLARADRP